jgi:hypothetical protein
MTNATALPKPTEQLEERRKERVGVKGHQVKNSGSEWVMVTFNEVRSPGGGASGEEI